MPSRTASEIDLARLIGEDGLRRLELAFGGCYIYVPSSPARHSELKNHLSYSEFAALVSYYGGTRLHVPKQVIKIERNRKIKQRLRAGESTAALGEEYGLTARQIRYIAEGEG